MNESAGRKFDLFTYDAAQRFTSYGYQIGEIFKLLKERNGKGIRVLHIGTGSGFFRTYFGARKDLRNLVTVVEMDYQRDLSPDVVADLRRSLPFADGVFDCVVCCQVMQYIPFSRLGLCLEEFARVLTPCGRAVLSFSNGGYYVALKIRLPGLTADKLFPIPFIRTSVSPKTRELWGEEYWEINRESHTVAEVIEELESRFHIQNQYRPLQHPYHHFFILERKGKNG